MTLPRTYQRISAPGSAASTGVSSFNTRTGAVTLSKADVTGTGLAAADISAVAVGTERFVYKAADQFVNAVAVVANDNTLALSVAANAVYKLEALLMYDSSTAADLDIKWAGLSGMSGEWSGQIIGSGASSGATNSVQDLSQHAWGSTVTCGGVGVGTVICMPLRGILIMGSSAQTLTLQWAQHASDATNTTMHLGSYLGLKQIA